MNKNKKILTLEDLENFYSKYKQSTHFSSKESGYQLAVQIPTTFETNDEMQDDTLLFCKSRMFHIGKNRNKSNVTEDAAKKAMKTMAYKPLLANFAEFKDDDGNVFIDFTSHDMTIENGKTKYIEHQIGCITADEPWFEEYEGKTYICGNLAIPKDYTEAVDIIERKNGTKVSVELLINELSYNAQEKCMLLTDVVVAGLTCLGRNPENGQEVEEGMVNSRLDIKDFSESNNSMFSGVTEDTNSKLIETLENLNKTLSNFNINKTEASESQKEHYEEGGQSVEDNKLNDETQVNEEDTELNTETDTEVEVDTDESKETDDTVTETEACGGGKKKKKKNNSDETDDGADDTTDEVDDTVSEPDTVEEPETTDTPEVTDEPEVLEDETDEGGEPDTEPPVDNIEDTEETPDEEAQVLDDDESSNSKKKKVENSLSKSFEISHDDIRYALYNLLSAYEDEDNDWYWIVSVYDNYFVYQGCQGNYFGQKYKVENEDVSFEGERYELFVEFLTKSEKTELDSMRSNYSSIMSELNTYKSNEINAQKEEIISDDAYAEFIETEEFKNIKEKIDTYSVDELRTACDLAFAKCVKAKGNFSFSVGTKEETNKVNKIGINANFEVNNDEPYGDYFKSLNYQY